MPRREYNPWDIPEERYQAMPPSEQRWVRELKLRRRLYQVAAILPLVGWPLYLLGVMWRELQQSTGLDGLVILVGIGVMLVILGMAITSAFMQASVRRGSRITGYVLGGVLNLGAVTITMKFSDGFQGTLASLSPVGWVVLALCGLSCLGSLVLIIANLKLGPYLEAEEAAKQRRLEDADEDYRLPPEPPSKW